MMGNKPSQVDLVIQEAEAELVKEGVEGASDTAKIVATLGGLPKAIASELRNGGVRMNGHSKREMAARATPPTLVITGILYLVIEKLLL